MLNLGAQITQAQVLERKIYHRPYKSRWKTEDLQFLLCVIHNFSYVSMPKDLLA